MNVLLEKYNDFLRLEKYTVEYYLSNGEYVKAIYRKENFLHLIGLHKLKDLQLIQFWLDRSNKTVKLPTVLKKIKNEQFTDKMVQSSSFYYLIKDRYNHFSYENLTTLGYTDAVIDFNPHMINSRINSNYILFEERPHGEYNHMGIVYNPTQNQEYIETFFHEPTDLYIKKQTTVKVKRMRLYDMHNNIIVDDSFEYN